MLRACELGQTGRYYPLRSSHIKKSNVSLVQLRQICVLKPQCCQHPVPTCERQFFFFLLITGNATTETKHRMVYSIKNKTEYCISKC